MPRITQAIHEKMLPKVKSVYDDDERRTSVVIRLVSDSTNLCRSGYIGALLLFG